MKVRLVLLVLLSIGIVGFAVAEERSLNSSKTAAIRKSVSTVLEQSTNALVKADARGIENAFSADFSTAGGDHHFDSRDELLKGVRAGQVKFSSIRTDVTNIRVPNADTAVVTGHRVARGVIDGKEVTFDYNLKAVYTRENGKWKALLWAVNGGC